MLSCDQGRVMSESVVALLGGVMACAGCAVGRWSLVSTWSLIVRGAAAGRDWGWHGWDELDAKGLWASEYEEEAGGVVLGDWVEDFFSWLNEALVGVGEESPSGLLWVPWWVSVCFCFCCFVCNFSLSRGT